MPLIIPVKRTNSGMFGDSNEDSEPDEDEVKEPKFKPKTKFELKKKVEP